MKNLYTFVLLMLTVSVFSQKLVRIKGSKNVILTERIFENLTALELNKDINLNLIKGEENKLEIYADDNLHEIIETDLNNGVLSISLVNRISSKKKFEMTLYVVDAVLETITLNANSKLTNLDYMIVNDLSLNVNEKAEANLLFNGNLIEVNFNDRAKGEISLKATTINFNQKESSKLKVLLDAEEVAIETTQKAAITLTGKVIDLNIDSKNTTKVKATNLKAESTVINAENNATVTINCLNDLEITAISKSRIFIYGSPTIVLKSFKGSASLFKKE